MAGQVAAAGLENRVPDNAIAHRDADVAADALEPVHDVNDLTPDCREEASHRPAKELLALKDPGVFLDVVDVFHELGRHHCPRALVNDAFDRVVNICPAKRLRY